MHPIISLASWLCKKSRIATQYGLRSPEQLRGVCRARRLFSGGLLLFATQLALPSTVNAQERVRHIMNGSIGDASVIIDASSTNGVEFFAQHSYASVLVYFAPRDVLRWTNAVERMLRRPVSSQAGEELKYDSPWLWDEDGGTIRIHENVEGSSVTWDLYCRSDHGAQSIFVHLQQNEVVALVQALQQGVAAVQVMKSQ